MCVEIIREKWYSFKSVQTVLRKDEMSQQQAIYISFMNCLAAEIPQNFLHDRKI